ncbi:Tuberous sclerosis 2-like protein [Blomia tropicalis]|nr:Tuberous sclerosis 2-like protein [Blomia tropicalis]
MERTNSLSERDATKDNPSSINHSRELHRTSSLGLDLITTSYRRWFAPSSNVHSPLQNSSQTLISPNGKNVNGTNQHHFQVGQIPEIQENCDTKSTAKSGPINDLIGNLMFELKNKTSGSLEAKLRNVDELINIVRNQSINEQTSSRVFRDMVELLDKNQPNELRHKVWSLYTILVQGRAENLGELRYFLFELIEKHDGRFEDIPYRIDLLIALTDYGKTLLYYESGMAEFMIHFYSKLIEKKTNVELKVKKLPTDVQVKLLTLMTNLVRYNASIMSQALSLMIQYSCQLAFESSNIEELKAIYDFLNVVLSYSHLPVDSLSQFVIVICVGVNKKEFYNNCNKLMKNLVGTYLGPATLNTLQHIIEDETNFNEKVLIRGAVYFLVQSLWGDMIKEKVTLSPNTVLPAFKNLILNESIASPYISLEIANGIHIFLSSSCETQSNIYDNRTETRTKNEFQEEAKQIIFEHTWELVLDICQILVYNTAAKENESKELVSMIQSLIENLQDLLEKILSLNLYSSYNDNLLLLNESTSLALLISNEKFVPRIFSTLEHGVRFLSDESILKLISNRFNYIGANFQNWIQDLKHLIEVFYQSNQIKTNIRVQFLLELKKFLELNSHFVNTDIFWEKVATIYFSHQTDLVSRELAVEFLIYLAKKMNSSKNLAEIVEIFESITNHNFKIIYQRQHSLEQTGQSRGHNQIMHQHSAPNHSDQSQHCDPIKTINGLIIIFQEKLDHPNCHSVAVHAFTLVIKFYSHFLNSSTTPYSYANTPKNVQLIIRIKYLIFNLILSMRSNSLGQLGVIVDQPQSEHFNSPASPFPRTINNEIIKFTPFIAFCLRGQVSPPTSPEQSILSTPYHLQKQSSTVSEGFQNCLIDALKFTIDNIRTETEWKILELIFEKLAKMLKNKGLILALGKQTINVSSNSVDFTTELSFPDLVIQVLDKFIDTLQNRLNDFNFCDIKLSRADILSHAYKSISELVGYNLNSSNQTLLLKCLKNGLVHFSSKTSVIRQCIISLTICSMEMQTTMNKFLKDIILTLSKISTSKTLAVPKLEFLSNIILFPDLYYTFHLKQYLAIFSIAQQFINPYKYGEYTVVLALRVISMWFLKSPSSSRLQLMKFLTKGLNTNILKEIEPITPQLPHQDYRSKLENRLSLTSTPPPPPTTPVNNSYQFSFSFQSSASNVESHPLSASSSSAFNVCASSSSQISTEGLILDPNDKENSKLELVEVCMDLFATNAFNTSSPLPLKPSMIDKLLNRQKAQMWLIGHKIIQITTTGCSSRAIRNGLCNKCYAICHLNQNGLVHEFGEGSSFPQSQVNIFQDNGQFNKQFNYESTNTSNMNNSTRRRHRSEINSSNTSSKNLQLSSDDFFAKRNLPFFPSDPDLNNGNVDNRYCRCWCQSWAEIVIRRSTGNTRWIMRVENNIGDFPYWSFAKEEDDLLANIFANYDPDCGLELIHNNLSNEKFEIEKNQLTRSKSSIGKNIQSVNSNISDHVSHKGRQYPVSRAASFGSRRDSNLIEQQQSFYENNQMILSEQTRVNVVRRLEKDDSFEEDEPPLLKENRQQQFSPINSNNSVELVTSGDKSSHNGNNYRERSTTISVMTPVQKSASSTGVSDSSPSSMNDSSKSTSTLNLASNRPSISSGALTPHSVFLQLYYNSSFKELNEISFREKPILLEKNESLTRSISCLDRVTPYETHKIGVIYIGPGQVNSKLEILANQMGSFRYTQFVQKLGHVINLANVNSNVCYTGGLDSKKDGPFAISWGDHLVQAIFHVATFMPNLPNDPNFNNKMAHIGNDFICIVYNNSGEKFDLHTIKGEGQFLQAMIVITPLEQESNSIQICAKREFIEFIGHTEAQIISDHSLPVYIRQLALHANLAAMNYKSYNISNWISRLRNIKRILIRATENLPLYNNEMIYEIRPPIAQQGQTHNRSRLGTGPSQSSRDDSDSVISPSIASPNIPSSAGLSMSSSNTFDYEHSIVRLSFPDFTDFTKDIC